MKQLNVFKTITVTVAVAGVVLFSLRSSLLGIDTLPANAAAIRVNTGNAFALVPTDNPNVFGHPVDGVAQVSLLGNCHFHGESEVHLPTSPGQPIQIISTSPWSLDSSDGKNGLKFDARGTATFDPLDPNFVNLTYQVTFVGGTGAFASATGTATMEVTAQFTSPLAGLGNWTMKGYVITPSRK